MSETATLLALLQRHYIKPGQDLPGGIFISEVGQNGGWGAGSRCDAIYVGFTSSSGRLLVGHELKVSRADWLNELNKPGKADAWADECHEWWIVVPNPAIIHDHELPAGWGVMSPAPRSKTRMQVHTKADRKDRNHRPSWDAVRSILARQDTLRAGAIAQIYQDAREKAWADVDARVEARVALHAQERPDTALLDKRIKLIETALGAPIDWRAAESDTPWHRDYRCVGLDELERIAKAVRAAGDLDSALARLTAGYTLPTTRIEAALTGLREALAELQEAHR